MQEIFSAAIKHREIYTAATRPFTRYIKTVVQCPIARCTLSEGIGCSAKVKIMYELRDSATPITQKFSIQWPQFTILFSHANTFYQTNHHYNATRVVSSEQTVHHYIKSPNETTCY